MKALEALNILNDLSASQRGLFTTAQATAAGVSRLTLSRLESNGQIERLMTGVYRSCAAPSFRQEDVWATWLALEPKKPAWERERDGSQGAVSHGTAAWILGLGELGPTPITFTLPTRKQTKRDGVRLVKGDVSPDEVITVAGIPTTKPVKTVIDLLDDGEDLSLVANVLNDAVEIDEDILDSQFAAKVNAFGKRYGLPADKSLYERLVRQQ